MSQNLIPPRSALVTGGGGFVGKLLIQRLLDQNCKVLSIGRSPQPELTALGVEHIQADLADAAAIQSACKGIDTVFHVAAKVGLWGKYQDFEDANINGTQAIIEGCQIHKVGKLIYTSTPSVVFNGMDLQHADESLPYGTDIPSHYPTTKAIAEAAVLAANSPNLKTTALRPHLIWGPGDTNLIPRVLERAKAGKLKIVGNGKNKVDMTYVDNVVDAHLDAEAALENHSGGKAYFISNDEPVELWSWINDLLESQNIKPISCNISLKAASKVGHAMEIIWRFFHLSGEPPMTRFVASELAKDHYFDISAAKNDLNYAPRVSMKEGLDRLLKSLD